jgi:SOS response associated peptidase (SRAP)/Phage integrase family
MCGRFTQRYTWSEVLQFLRVFGPARNLQPHYNIAPTMTVDVIRLDESGNRELVPMRWGLIPAWWVKSLKEITATFNARAESVADKPMFRDAFKATHSLRRTKASIIYKQTGNLRAVQILFGHTKIESTVRYLGVDIEDALALAEGTEV